MARRLTTTAYSANTAELKSTIPHAIKLCFDDYYNDMHDFGQNSKRHIMEEMMKKCWNLRLSVDSMNMNWLVGVKSKYGLMISV